MTKKKQIKPAGVPEWFFDSAVDAVLATMEQNYAELMRENMSDAQKRWIFHDLAEDSWRIFQHYIYTREEKKIPAVRYDMLIKAARIAVKNTVVVKPKKTKEEREAELLAFRQQQMAREILEGKRA